MPLSRHANMPSEPLQPACLSVRKQHNQNGSPLDNLKFFVTLTAQPLLQDLVKGPPWSIKDKWMALCVAEEFKQRLSCSLHKGNPRKSAVVVLTENKTEKWTSWANKAVDCLNPKKRATKTCSSSVFGCQYSKETHNAIQKVNVLNTM